MKLNDLPRTVLADKKRVNVTLAAKLIEEAKILGLNVSQCAEEGLRAKVKQTREAQWIEENRDAMLAWNEWVRKHGTFGDKLRAWKKKRGAV
jgi:antitoxin CcdA